LFDTVPHDHAVDRRGDLGPLQIQLRLLQVRFGQLGRNLQPVPPNPVRRLLVLQRLQRIVRHQDGPPCPVGFRFADAARNPQQAIQFALLQFPVSLGQRDQRLEIGLLDVEFRQFRPRTLAQLLRAQSFEFIVPRVDFHQRRPPTHIVAGTADVRLELHAAGHFRRHLDLAHGRHHAVDRQCQIAVERPDRQRLDHRRLTRVFRGLGLLLASAQRQHHGQTRSQDQQRQRRTNQKLLHT